VHRRDPVLYVADKCWPSFISVSSLKLALILLNDIPQVKKFGDKPALVAFYAKTAAKAFEPRGKEIGQVYYETSLAQVNKGCENSLA